MAGIREISCEELVNAMQSDAVPTLMDVRERHEFAVSSIEGSVCIPLTELGAALNAMPADSPIVFVCEIGERSRQAASFATMVGFRQTFSLRGGIKAWMELHA